MSDSSPQRSSRRGCLLALRTDAGRCTPVVIELKNHRLLNRLEEQISGYSALINEHPREFQNLFEAVLGEPARFDAPAEKWIVWPADGDGPDRREGELARDRDPRGRVSRGRRRVRVHGGRRQRLAFQRGAPGRAQPGLGGPAPRAARSASTAHRAASRPRGGTPPPRAHPTARPGALPRGANIRAASSGSSSTSSALCSSRGVNLPSAPIPASSTLTHRDLPLLHPGHDARVHRGRAGIRALGWLSRESRARADRAAAARGGLVRGECGGAGGDHAARSRR